MNYPKRYEILDLWNILVKYIEDNKKYNDIDYKETIKNIDDLIKELKDEYKNYIKGV